MLRKYKEPILLLGIMALAIFMLLEANSIHIGRGRTPVGPAVWPRVMLGGMLLFSVILFVMDLLKIRKGNVLEVRQDDGESADTADLAENRSEYPLRGLFTLVFLTAYLILLPVTGFIATTAVLLFIYLLSLRIKVSHSFLISAATTVVLTYLFPHVLSVPLPRGVGVFLSLTKVFY